MAKVLAFIDGSAYSQSVCDHAAWAVARMTAPVEVLHVLGRRQVSSVPADLGGSLAADDREALLAELSGFDEQHAKLAHKRGWLILDEAKARLVSAGAAVARGHDLVPRPVIDRHRDRRVQRGQPMRR